MVRLNFSNPDHKKHSGAGFWWKITKQTGSEFMEDNCMRLAAALSMYAVLALAPLIVVLVKVAAVSLGPERAAHLVESRLSSTMGTGQSAIHQMVINATHPSAGRIVAIVSFILVLFSASKWFRELTDDIDTIWKVKKRKDLGWWETIMGKLFPISLVLLMAAVMLGSVVATTVISHISRTLSDGLTWVTPIVDEIAAFVVLSVMFTLLFKYLPSAKVQWKDALIGGTFSGVLFVIGQYFLSLYFRYGAPASAYGAMGSIVAVLLWVYYTSQIVFLGAEFTQVNARMHGRALEPTENAVKVKIEEQPAGGRMGKVERERAR